MANKEKQNYKQILIRDFNTFVDVMKSTVKIIDSAKLQINENGLTIYGARAKIARCEITSNAIYSNEDIAFSILDMQMFVKVLSTIREIHDNDYSDFKFLVDSPFVRFESKKFKTKISTCNEDIIVKWISTPIDMTKLTPVFEFTTTNDMIRRVRNHQFIFSDPSTIRIYLETKKDMENNAIFATIGNKQTNLNNEITLKFGLVTFNSDKNNSDRQMIIDLDRLNLFDAVQTNDIKISLMNLNVLVSKVKVLGKNDSYFNITVFNSLLKA